MAVPVFPLNTVLFPGVPMTLRIFEDRYIRMLADRAASSPLFVVSLIQSGREVSDEPCFHRVGTTARLATLNALSPNLVDIVVVGEQRVSLSPGDWSRGYATAEGSEASDTSFDQQRALHLLRTALRTYKTYGTGAARLIGRRFSLPAINLDPARASFDLAARLPLHPWEQQELLEERDPLARLEKTTAVIGRELALMFKGGVVGVPLQYPGERFNSN